MVNPRSLAPSGLLGLFALCVIAPSVLSQSNDPSERNLADGQEHLRGSRVQPRIVGGSDVARGQFPWFVRIDVNSSPATCGGSLVAADVVLTAAHCKQEGVQDSQIKVLINGYHDNPTENGDQEYKRVRYSLKHPDNNPSILFNDVMLLKLDSPVSLDIPYVELNRDEDEPKVGDTLTIMGLGALFEGKNDYPDILQATQVRVTEHAPCNIAYAGLGVPVLDDVALCAGQLSGTDACQGDSGGPLIDHRGQQVGVMSFGYGCARVGYPGVYARTMVRGDVKDWIGETICKISIQNDKPDWCLPDSSPPQPPQAASPLHKATSMETDLRTKPQTTNQARKKRNRRKRNKRRRKRGNKRKQKPNQPQSSSEEE